jgi:hypothetical protein
MFDVRKTIRAYIEMFPGSFVGFIYTMADILNSIGDEWKAVGRDKWADGLQKAAITLRSCAQDLSVIANEHDKEFDGK